jgi:hypothetical protein
MPGIYFIAKIQMYDGFGSFLWPSSQSTIIELECGLLVEHQTILIGIRNVKMLSPELGRYS